ncbi:MAG: heparan-alpha-glucosaminide N-acetyltransferase [Candidatus Thermoplasmatota archaeon]
MGPDITVNKKRLLLAPVRICTHTIKKRSSQRFIELDILRGIAILLMIFFHILWDLDYFGIVPLNHQIYAFQKIAPIMFFLLLGMCLVVSTNNTQKGNPDKQKKYRNHLILRGLKIFSFGMILTTGSFIFIPDRPVIFGVLHCIGVSIILSIPFLYRSTITKIVSSGVVMIAGYFFGQYIVPYPSAVHLAIGFHQTNVYSYTVDYFPIFPWLGVCLLGMALADIFYADNTRRIPSFALSKSKPCLMVSWLGRHSLSVYMVHQPIIAGIILLYIFL